MKSLVKSNKGQIAEKSEAGVQHYRPGYELQISKKINPVGKLAIIALYTVAVIFTTLKITKEEKRVISYEQKEILKRQIIKELNKDQVKLTSYQSHNSIPKVDNTPKTMVFSEKNLQILKYQQNLKYERFKKELEEKRELFISNLDLNDPVAKKALTDFDDKMKLDLYSYRANNRETIKKFKEEKILVSQSL